MSTGSSPVLTAMKRILRFFGLVPVNDVIELLNNESKYWIQKRKELNNTEDILKENYTNQFSNYSQCCLDLKTSIHLLNKK